MLRDAQGFRTDETQSHPMFPAIVAAAAVVVVVVVVEFVFVFDRRGKCVSIVLMRGAFLFCFGILHFGVSSSSPPLPPASSSPPPSALFAAVVSHVLCTNPHNAAIENTRIKNDFRHKNVKQHFDFDFSFPPPLFLLLCMFLFFVVVVVVVVFPVVVERGEVAVSFICDD